MVTCSAVGFHFFISKFDFIILNNDLLMFVWSRFDKNRIQIWDVTRFGNRIRRRSMLVGIGDRDRV